MSKKSFLRRKALAEIELFHKEERKKINRLMESGMKGYMEKERKPIIDKYKRYKDLDKKRKK